MFKTLIYGMPLKKKLYFIFGISIAAIILAVSIGMLSFARIQIGGSAYGEIENRMLTADNIARLRANLAFVRTTLLTMIIDDDAERRQSNREAIAALSSRIDELFDTINGQLKSEGQAELIATMDEGREAWTAFRDTRDAELIPHIFAGRTREAMALARGVQAERYRRFEAATKVAVDRVREGIPGRVAAIKKESNVVQAMFIAGSVIFITFFASVAVFFSRTIVNPVVLVSDRSRLMASGDFTMAGMHRGRGTDEIGVMMQSFATMMGRVGETVGHLKTSIANLSSSSEELSATAEDLSKGASRQAGQAKEVTAAADQMSQTVSDVAQNAAQAADASKNSSEAASTGKEIVEKTAQGLTSITEAVREASETIEALSRSSAQIGEIVNLIHTIADQTNLLALNAAIEAARAGDQGRGFAVVADEVRKLADRTTNATKDIEERISAIQSEAERSLAMIRKGNSEVERGMGLARSASLALDTIVADSTQVTDMVQRIAAATEEQSATAEEITRNMNDIAEVVDRTSEATIQIQQAAQALARLAAETQSMIAWFKTDPAGARKA